MSRPRHSFIMGDVQRFRFLDNTPVGGKRRLIIEFAAGLADAMLFFNDPEVVYLLWLMLGDTNIVTEHQALSAAVGEQPEGPR